MARWLQQQGLQAGSFHTEYGAEGGELSPEPVAAAEPGVAATDVTAAGGPACCVASPPCTPSSTPASPPAKLAALQRYLAQADPADAACALYFLAGGKPHQTLPTALLRAEATAVAGISDWPAEWKYDGIRAQVVCQAGQVWIWSRGEELISERLPEVVAAAQGLPDGTVLDGELLVWIGGAPAPFNPLQLRLNRKTLSRKLLGDAPVRFIAYDLLARAGTDLRSQPQHARRQQLEAVLAASPLQLSPLLVANDGAGLAALRGESRQRGVEGLMLKRRDAAYGSGRTKSTGTWWKWKVDAMAVDGVMVCAQAGHGRRAGLYTDDTFAVWNRTPANPAEASAVVEAIVRREPPRPGALQLLTFAKAYSGLTDAEFKAVDKVIRAHTLKKFGPVRSLRPTLVFELAFEGIAHSPRHKSGVALRFPRMLRVRHDKPLHEADSLAVLSGLIPQEDAQN